MVNFHALFDFANAQGATGEIFDPNSLEDLSTSDTLKDDLFDIISAFPEYQAATASPSEAKSPSIAEVPLLPTTENEVRKDISDFIDDISDILTTSEICSLFSNPVAGSIPFDLAFDKRD